MGYTEDDRYVRVDFFKPSGKWYSTESVFWDNQYYDGYIIDDFKAVLKEHLKERLTGMYAICLKPHHISPYPLMVNVK